MKRNILRVASCSKESTYKEAIQGKNTKSFKIKISLVNFGRMSCRTEDDSSIFFLRIAFNKL